MAVYFAGAGAAGAFGGPFTFAFSAVHFAISAV